MKALRKFILTFIAIAIFLFGFFMMRYFASQKTDPPQRPATVAKRFVNAQKVIYQDIKTSIETSGRVIAGKSVVMISEVPGKIIQGELLLKQGQSFKKGQLIFKIDNREAKYSLSAQKSQFLTALAAILPDVKIDFPEHFAVLKRFFDEVKIDSDLPPLPGINDNTFNTFIATKNVLNLYYSIKSAEERLKKYNYYAPFNGTIFSVNLEVGSVVNPGVNVGQIISTSEYEVEVPIKAVDINWVTKDKEVWLVLDEHMQMPGKIVRISKHLDPNTQSINVYVKVDKNHKMEVYDGMYLKVTIAGPIVADAMEIPRKAIFNENKVYFVNDGKLQIGQIEIEKLNAESAIVTGPKQGTIIVTESVINGFENMSVQTNLDS